MSMRRLQKYPTGNVSLHRSEWLGQISLRCHFTGKPVVACFVFLNAVPVSQTKIWGHFSIL